MNSSTYGRMAVSYTHLMRNYGQHNLKIGLNEWNFDLNYWSASTQWDATVNEYPAVSYTHLDVYKRQGPHGRGYGESS